MAKGVEKCPIDDSKLAVVVSNLAVSTHTSLDLILYYLFIYFYFTKFAKAYEISITMIIIDSD